MFPANIMEDLSDLCLDFITTVNRMNLSSISLIGSCGTVYHERIYKHQQVNHTALCRAVRAVSTIRGMDSISYFDKH